MIQVYHPGATCSRYVIEDTPNSVTVHYTCPGAGHGRTTIRSETNRLVQIDTQGIAEGRPFSQAIEARRTGGCRSEEHTSELQSLMRISYDVFCLKIKSKNAQSTT